MVNLKAKSIWKRYAFCGGMQIFEELGVDNQHLTTPDTHVDAAVESNKSKRTIRIAIPA